MDAAERLHTVDFAYAVPSDGVAISCIAFGRVNRRLALTAMSRAAWQKRQHPLGVDVRRTGRAPNPAWAELRHQRPRCAQQYSPFLKHRSHSESLPLGERLLDKVLAALIPPCAEWPRREYPAGLPGNGVYGADWKICSPNRPGQIAGLCSGRRLLGECRSGKADHQTISAKRAVQRLPICREDAPGDRGAPKGWLRQLPLLNPIRVTRLKIRYLSSGKGMVNFTRKKLQQTGGQSPSAHEKDPCI